MKMELIRQLCNAHGISGYESDVTKIMEKELKKTCVKVETDNLGNLIATKGKGKKKIMIAAHMDEIGLMIKHIDDQGFLSFIKIGGIDNRALMNQRVHIKTKKTTITGIIGSKPPHLQKSKEKDKVIEHDEMFIDIGAKNKKEAEKRVEIGDPVIFEPNYGQLSKETYYGKAIDNRLGCYIMLKVMENLSDKINLTVYAVGTTQEEVGLKGARVCAFRLNPEYAFAVDTTIAGDTPQIKKTESSLEIGKGPAITITEASGRGVVTHPRIRELLTKTAKENKIPYQMDVIEGGMTDGAIIYLTREGIPTGVLSVPCRYIHGATGVFDIRDVNDTIKLLTKSIEKISESI